MNSALRRPTCPRCLRPSRACLCAWVRACDNEVELLLLQHPQEQAQAKGTARLLQLSLARCRLEVGERFDPARLGVADGRSLLLYPGDADGDGASATPAHATDADADAGPLRLIVLDATWRKSRLLLHLNPWLRQLPRLALAAPPPSRYGAIRKAHAPKQLSTLEASLLALQQLEGRPQRYAALWQGFEGFIAQQQAFRPAPPAG
ncbi:MAG: tRNA-uridine aminocarboxypropyltransferase [Burkholderiaceae bacterium]